MKHQKKVETGMPVKVEAQPVYQAPRLFVIGSAPRLMQGSKYGPQHDSVKGRYIYHK